MEEALSNEQQPPPMLGNPGQEEMQIISTGPMGVESHDTEMKN